MRLTAFLLLLALIGAAVLLWSTGSFEAIAWWASRQQHVLQSSLARSLSGLRDGDPAALGSLLMLCAGYGFVHALGPGHGKVLVTGAAVATRATALRMALIAVAGSVAQALVAIALVYGAFTVFAASARSTVAASETWIVPFGNLMIGLIGVWLMVRGLRSLLGRRIAGPAQDDAHGPDCGHHHGPSVDAVARATGPGATLALIAAMAARPCTGALMVLAIAWRMDIRLAGAAGVLAMGLGTAAFTVLVAILAVGSRDAAFLSAGNAPAARLLAPGLQVIAGGLIVAVSGTLLLAASRA